ncbi:hypothetical protein NKH77_44100 [Streptomyces sp. M19]
MPRLRQVLSIWSRPEPFLKKCRATYGSRFRVTIIPGVSLFVISAPEDVKQMFFAPATSCTPAPATPHREVDRAEGPGLAGRGGAHRDAPQRHAELPRRRAQAGRAGGHPARQAGGRVLAAGAGRVRPPFAHRYTTKVILEVLFGEHRPPASPRCSRR